MNLIAFCTNTIKYSFYALFLLVPLVFAGNTSELFELNKMWVTFILTIIISLAWVTKIVLERKISIQRTPLDIPILLFLLSQIISTIFSLDMQVSWWGYYSRFNGGLASTLCYVILYYALVSHFSVKNILTLLKVTLIGGIITALWGLPSHFNYDPTCLVFRGTLDTSCWTEAFKPTIRAFSTLGQPAWFAAYLAVLIPLAITYLLQQRSKLLTGWFLAVTILLYLNLIFANTRAGFLGFIFANVVFWAIIYLKKFFDKKIFLRSFIALNLILLVINFFFGIPVEGLSRFTLPAWKSAEKPASQPAQKTTTQPTPAPQQATPASEINITDSGKIRLYVWQGAIDAWKSSPLFGTGVETFAFAYYKFRPVGHNTTSEWDYLYNKAHNEYLNYLTTTGLFGLGTYLLFIGLFIFQVGKQIWISIKTPTSKNALSNAPNSLLAVGLFTGWLSILISNFFGFSVVIMNLFLFLIPAFVIILSNKLPNKKIEIPNGNSESATSPSVVSPNPYQWTAILIFTIFAGYLIVSLIQYWIADTKYALGANLDRVGSYQQAYPLLLAAAQAKPNEAVFKDELAINIGVLATALAAQKDQTNAAQFMSDAISLNDEVVNSHPNNVVYWKNRVRLFYTLAQSVNSNQQMQYYLEALKAIQKASELAPTDAKISYNLGVLEGQTGDIQKGIATLEQTIKMKADYRDAYFALGLFYHQLAVNQNNYVINPAMQQKAIDTYEYILKNISPNDPEVQNSLKEWGVK